MGPPSSGQYSITVDQPYYQQESVRRVTVSGDPPFSSLYVQARIQGQQAIGGWTSPLPDGYTNAYCATSSGPVQAVIKTGGDYRSTAVFEWIPPFTNTSVNVIFMVTFVSPPLYYILSSHPITDPCVPNPCQSDGDVCFRGSTAPGYVCADPCDIISCQYGGTCTVGVSGQAECPCPQGLTGTNCESCDDQHCLNGGMCIINTGGSAQCLCLGSWMGTRCEIPRTGPCSSSPCLNQGTCTVTTSGGYSCTCTAIYTGSRCEQMAQDPCSPNLCQNGGTCVRSGTEAAFASCQCADGFSGVRCEIVDGFCSRGLCRNGATCIPFPDGGGGLCECAEGFSGPACEIVEGTDFCHQNLCKHGATCVPLSAESRAGQCVCPPGYTGALCEDTIQGGSEQPSFCEQSPCMNGGSCRMLPMGGGQCQCPPDYTGSWCEQPRGICTTIGIELCKNGATCVNTENGFSCLCPEGYTGYTCDEIEPGYCSRQSAQGICMNGATCVEMVGGFTCACTSGYTGFDCSEPTDTGICTTIGIELCKNGATCVNTQDGFSCLCPEGYTGYTCDEIEPAEGFCTTVGIEICKNGGTCIDTADGGFECRCPDRYTGFTCAEAEPGLCETVGDGFCENGGTCVNMESGFSCVCPQGYTGFTCELETGPCSPNPCFNGGMCSPDGSAPSGLKCDCTPGYVGLLCQSVDPCQSNPCQNFGTCHVNQETGRYVCDCRNPEFYMGANCNIVSPCISNPCQNGGRCSFVELNNGYQCTCPEPYRGDSCESIDICRATQPCRNGATCFPQSGTEYYCHCPDGYSGDTCETGDSPATTPCSPNPCNNQGTCTIDGSTFRCQCPSHTLGRTCNIGNPCDSSPCFSGSTCIPATSGLSYRCECPPGRMGTNCQSSIDACSNSPCVNGTCINDPRVASLRRCECFDGYDGDLCDNLADFCLARKPCLNGGVCRNIAADPRFTCTCPNRYRGDTCLFDLNEELAFDNCPDGEIAYPITSGNVARITFAPIARVPETGELIEDFEIIVGSPSQEFPGDVVYDEKYLEGQTFSLRVSDQFDRQGTCSFTVKLLDQVPPVIICPDDHEDVSQDDQVQLATLPLPSINVTDNIGIREEDPIEFKPTTVKTDGTQQQITVTTFDEAGNSMECQFGLRVHKKSDACTPIDGANGRVSCAIQGFQNNQVCTLTCDEGFAAINGESYACDDSDWDKQPLPCVPMRTPNSLSKVIRFVYPLEGSCEVKDSRFIIDAQEAMKEELDQKGLCVFRSARTCSQPDSIKASCIAQEEGGGSTPQRQRREAGEAVAIDVIVFGMVGGAADQGEVEADIEGLVRMMEETPIELNIGGERVAYDSATASPRFSSTCSEGSVSRDGNCLICPAGTRQDGDECSLCIPGTYQSLAGQTFCEPCEPKQFQNASGATSCQACPTSRTPGEFECLEDPEPAIDWVMIIIYACVGVGACLIVIIFILMVCLWRSTQEEKRQDLKRWELGQLTTQMNNSYEPEEETGFRQRHNTTVSTSTYQTVPEGDGTPNLGNGYTSGLVPIPVDELYAGLNMEGGNNTVMAGVDHHRGGRGGHNRYHHDNGPSNGFSHDRHNFNV